MVWTMAIHTREAKSGPWSFSPETTGLGHEKTELYVFFQSIIKIVSYKHKQNVSSIVINRLSYRR
jgi:hypothetical protein